MLVESGFEIKYSGSEEAKDKNEPERFHHTGTEIAVGLVEGIEAYTPAGKSYHMETYGYFGVQVKYAKRTDKGWRTWEELRK